MKAASAASSRNNRNNRNATRRRNNNKNAKVAHAKTFLTRKVRKVIEEIHEDLKVGHVLPPKLREYLERLIVEDLKRDPVTAENFEGLVERKK